MPALQGFAHPESGDIIVTVTVSGLPSVGGRGVGPQLPASPSSLPLPHPARRRPGPGQAGQLPRVGPRTTKGVHSCPTRSSPSILPKAIISSWAYCHCTHLMGRETEAGRGRTQAVVAAQRDHRARQWENRATCPSSLVPRLSHSSYSVPLGPQPCSPKNLFQSHPSVCPSIHNLAHRIHQRVPATPRLQPEKNAA